MPPRELATSPLPVRRQLKLDSPPSGILDGPARTDPSSPYLANLKRRAASARTPSPSVRRQLNLRLTESTLQIFFVAFFLISALSGDAAKEASFSLQSPPATPTSTSTGMKMSLGQFGIASQLNRLNRRLSETHRRQSLSQTQGEADASLTNFSMTNHEDDVGDSASLALKLFEQNSRASQNLSDRARTALLFVCLYSFQAITFGLLRPRKVAAVERRRLPKSR